MDEEPIRIPVTDVFDLHSVPDRDVRGVVEAYLEEARDLGFRYVRIIHGRGIGVRREMVRAMRGPGRGDGGAASCRCAATQSR